MTVTLTTGASAAPVTGDLVVRGTLQRGTDVTVSKVLVAGVAATSDAFDFAAFDATVPAATLQGLAVTQGSPDRATVAVTALTNCDATPLTVATLTVPLAAKAVTSLAFAPSPAAPPYLPTSKQIPARLELVANPEAAGASVTVTTSLGTVNGSTSTTVTLSGGGGAPATAVVVLNADPTREGTAHVVASAVAATAETEVQTAGPPAFLPATLQLVPGTTAHVTVFTRGTLRECSATAAPGLTVTSGLTDLTTGTSVVDLNGDGAPDILIVVAAGATAPSASTAISCLDIFGQSAVATFAVPK